MGDTTASKSAVEEEAVNAIGWVQQLVGYPPVSDRKEPVSSDMIATLVNSLIEC